MVLRGRGGAATPAGGCHRGRRAPAVSEVKVGSAAALAAGAVQLQGQHRPDRDQRVRRVCRPDRGQRRSRAERELVVLQEPRLQGEADGQRGRELVGAERRQDRRLGDDRRRARRLRPAAPRGRAGADRLLARRRRRHRPQGHQADQPAEGQDDRRGAVHRGGLLHPLPGAGSRAADPHARQPRRDAASGPAEPRLHRGRLRAPAICSPPTSSPARTGLPAR